MLLLFVEFVEQKQKQTEQEKKKFEKAIPIVPKIYLYIKLINGEKRQKDRKTKQQHRTFCMDTSQH